MEAGTSIKLESGFKLCNGADFKASVDGSNPMLKSSSVEQIEPPNIVGNKYATTNDRYAVAATQSRNRTIEWTLIGIEYKYQVVSNELVIPEDFPKGQYTLFAKFRNNGQEESSSRVIIIKNALHDDLSLEQSWNSNIIVAYPNPANEKVTIKIEKESLSELELFIK